jgi:hypothetical protein
LKYLKKNLDGLDMAQLHYYMLCASAFARAKDMNPEDAVNYLHEYKGFEFLDKCHEEDNFPSQKDAVEKLTRVCRNNGGNII